MGHTRLGKIPKSKKWTIVVENLTGSNTSSPTSSDSAANNVDSIAKQTLEAAQGGLQISINDLGLRYTFFLLSQIVLAARTDHWQHHLTELGIRLTEDATLYDLATEMQSVIDDFLYHHNSITDISEMAQKAAGESLVTLAAPRVPTLFGSGPDEIKHAVHSLSTKKGFADLGQQFFGTFMALFLNFYLSRITATHVNGNILHQIGDVSHFNETLRLHCKQSAHIVRDFCGEWYSKTEYLEGITLDNTSAFIAIALRKLQAELRQQEIDV